MEHWKDLILKDELTDEELREIPARCAVNNNEKCDRFIKAGLDIDMLLLDTGMTYEEATDPNFWMNPVQAQRFDANYFFYLPGLETHHQNEEDGRNFIHAESSAIKLVMLLSSMKRLFSRVQEENEKFNNECFIEFKTGREKLKYFIHPRTFYYKMALGYECHYMRGVWHAILAMHGFSDIHIEEHICSKRLENIVTLFYRRLSLEYSERDGDIYINHLKVGEIRPFDSVDIVIPRREKCHVPEGAMVSVITENFDFDGKVLFRAGEVYDAPFCCGEAQWKKKNLAKRLFSRLNSYRELATTTIEKLEEQLDLARLKIHEVRQAQAEALREKEESERRLNLTEIYTKRSLVEIISEGGDPTTFSPSEEQFAVLFNDIRGFTSMAEEMTAVDVVSFLNEYFYRMNSLILSNHGEIDKLMGDCIMARFADPGDAVQAAVLMNKRLTEYNREREERGRKKILTGTGITFGDVIVGNIGSGSKMDYTVIGDTVNAASRLESLSKYYHVDIIISEAVYEKCGGIDEARCIDTVVVKGRQAPVKIYEVYSHKSDEVKGLIHSIQPLLDEARELYVKGNLKGAHKIYSELVKQLGPGEDGDGMCADPILNFYKKRCETVSREIRAGVIKRDSWNGIYEFVDK